MKYSLTCSDLASGVSDTFKTLLGIEVPDTAGKRFRLTAVHGGFADDSPRDQQCAIAIKRIDDLSAGGAGTSTAISAGDVAKKDPGSVDCSMNCERAYSDEPTTYDTETLWATDVNGRGAFNKEWLPEEAPIFTQDQFCGLLAASRTSTAFTVSATLEFEEF
jgi:hypothetical protein